jgi:Dolichyl-phosphate-mannose-protein mannosyltransferase
MQNRSKLDPAEYFFAAGILLAGVFFRLYQLPGQILVDDEWHAVHKIIAADYRGIFTDFGWADHCIPFTLFYEFLRNNFWISEFLMRLPSIVAGFLALLVVPLLLRRLIGTKAAVVTACLLSIAPLHVFYSRYARPYSFSMLLSFVAVMAFYFWWTERRKAWIVLYVITGVLSAWCLLPALPFVAGPFLFALLHTAFRRELWAGFKRLLVPGFCFMAGFLALTLPPIMNRPAALFSKAGQDSVSFQSLIGTVELFAGSPQMWLVIIMLFLFAAGLYFLSRENCLFGLYTFFLVWLQAAGFLIAGPAGSNVSIVFNRYSIAVLPFFLAWTAMALVHRYRKEWMNGIGKYSFVLLACLLILYGPFRGIYFYPNHFTNDPIFQIYYHRDQIMEHGKPTNVPPFYNELAKYKNGQKTILEAPFHYADNIYFYYQWIHRQHIYIGFVGDMKGTFRAGEVPVVDGRFRLRNCIHLSDFRKIEEKGVDFVILHRALEKERASIIPVSAADMGTWEKMYRERYGSPEYEDSFMTVFRIH